jgi:hypothetical protein
MLAKIHQNDDSERWEKAKSTSFCHLYCEIIKDDDNKMRVIPHELFKDTKNSISNDSLLH